MEVPSPDIVDLIGSVDSSGIVDVRQPNAKRHDRLVTCRSGKKHLIRYAGDPQTLLREHWGYETMHRLGVPCPQIEKWAEPGDRFPGGCMILQWMDPVTTPAATLDRDGTCERTLSLCRKLGRALRRLHSAEVSGDIPDFIPRPDRASAAGYGQRKARRLREAGLVDEAFERKFLDLVEACTAPIPDPHPATLCFQDMHFRNILVSTEPDPEVVAFIDVAETAVGCPIWDFTNWERWELLYGHSWARQPVLEAYGDLDMALYRFAVLVRFSESHQLFRGVIREQINRAVESGDIMAFDLDRLRAEA